MVRNPSSWNPCWQWDPSSHFTRPHVSYIGNTRVQEKWEFFSVFWWLAQLYSRDILLQKWLFRFSSSKHRIHLTGSHKTTLNSSVTIWSLPQITMLLKWCHPSQGNFVKCSAWFSVSVKIWVKPFSSICHDVVTFNSARRASTNRHWGWELLTTEPKAVYLFRF